MSMVALFHYIVVVSLVSWSNVIMYLNTKNSFQTNKQIDEDYLRAKNNEHNNAGSTAYLLQMLEILKMVFNQCTVHPL